MKHKQQTQTNNTIIKTNENKQEKRNTTKKKR